MWLWSRGRSWFEAAVRRLLSHLDPRAPIVYQRSAVSGHLVGIVASQDREHVRSIAEHMGYKVDPADPSQLRYLWAGLTLLFVELSVDQSDGVDELTEEISLPGWVSYLLVGALLGTFGWVYLPSPAGAVVACGVLAVFGGFLVGFVFIPSPLASYCDHVRLGTPIGDREEIEGHRTVDVDTYQASCIGPPLTALVGGFTATGPVFLTGLPILAREIRQSPYVDLSMVDTWFVFPLAGAVWMLGFWGLGFSIGMFVYTFENESTRIKVFPFDLVARIPTPVPELSGGYFSLLGLAIVPLVALTNSSFLLPAAYRLSSLRLWAYFMLPATIITMTLPVFLYWWVVQNREYVYTRTLGNLSDVSSGWRRGGIGLLTIGASGLLLWSLSEFLRKFWSYLGAPLLNQNLLPVLEKPFLVALLIVSLLPACYVVLGVGIQTVAHLGGLTWTVVRSVPVGETPFAGIPVRMTPDEAPQAAAVAIGPWRAVVISQGLYDQLDDRAAFAGLLAHEEAHFKREDSLVSDAQMSTVIPILAAITLTGKNVFYALADYRSREMAADDYAVDKVGREPLLRALDQIRGESNSSSMGASFVPLVSAYTPGTMAGPPSVRAAIERYFGLLFGRFALIRAHPSPADRRDRLETDD